MTQPDYDNPMWGMTVEPKSPEEHAASCCSPERKQAIADFEGQAEQALANAAGKPPVNPTIAPALRTPHAAEDTWFGGRDDKPVAWATGVAKVSWLRALRLDWASWREFRAARKAGNPYYMKMR